MLQDPTARIGQLNGFSAKDVERLGRMYENSTMYGNLTLRLISNCVINSSHATRSQFITFIVIITLNICTHLQ